MRPAAMNFLFVKEIAHPIKMTLTVVDQSRGLIIGTRQRSFRQGVLEGPPPPDDNEGMRCVVRGSQVAGYLSNK